MKIAFLGTGSWGFCLASLLASKGYQVVSWTTKPALAKQLNEHREHPLFPGHRPEGEISFTTKLTEAIDGADMIVEAVTSAGIRPVFTELKPHLKKKCPIVITSKGIEQNSGLILPEVVIESAGENFRRWVGILSGPSYAAEVIHHLPTSVVGSAFDFDVMMTICQTFMTGTFRVYPNQDIKGVAYGGALKNIIAIACGISDGLNLGNSSKAALITRGLHEIRKLAVASGCRADTLNGLSGLGDLCLTCSSTMSRNFKFGFLLAQGLSGEQAKERIGMVVEGAYTAVSALQLSEQLNISMPISEAVNQIIYQNMKPIDAVRNLMKRDIKEEHL